MGCLLVVVDLVVARFVPCGFVCLLLLIWFVAVVLVWLGCGGFVGVWVWAELFRFTVYNFAVYAVLVDWFWCWLCACGVGCICG